MHRPLPSSADLTVRPVFRVLGAMLLALVAFINAFEAVTLLQSTAVTFKARECTGSSRFSATG